VTHYHEQLAAGPALHPAQLGVLGQPGVPGHHAAGPSGGGYIGVGAADLDDVLDSYGAPLGTCICVVFLKTFEGHFCGFLVDLKASLFANLCFSNLFLIPELIFSQQIF
jgi:hypothetical protein